MALPRAVLVHDNGKDFTQYAAKTNGGKVRNCHVQYCEYLGDGTGFRQYSTENKTIEQVIKLFRNPRPAYLWRHKGQDGL